MKTKMKIQEMYIAALESLEKIQNLNPRTSDLPSVERAKIRNTETEVVLAFVRLNVKGEMVEKQDAVLASLSSLV